MENFGKSIEMFKYMNESDETLDLSEKQFHMVEEEISNYDALHLIKNRLRHHMNLKYFDGKNDLNYLGRFEKDESKNSYKLVINKKISKKGLEILSEIVNFAKNIKAVYN